MFCMECGEKLPDHANFCFKCGAKVNDAAPYDSAPVPEPQQTKPPKHRLFDMLQEYATGRGTEENAAAGGEAPPAPAPEKVPKSPAASASAEKAAYELEELFASLDPVACHSEYYFLKSGNPMLGASAWR